MNRFVFQGSFASAQAGHVSGPGAQRPGPAVPIVVPGSSRQSPDENLAEYGAEIVRLLHVRFETARREGRTVLFDAATGRSPQAAYVALGNALRNGSASLNGVILAGHEEAWGPFEPGSNSDLDAYRRKLLEANGIDARPITRVFAECDRVADGNFLPMHLDDDPGRAAVRYAELFSSLQMHTRVTTVGLYGVGVDGHVAEVQAHDMGWRATLAQREPYMAPLPHYSVEHGAIHWARADGGFHPEDNVFWARDAGDGEAVGRAVWQGYTGIEFMVGIGWRQLLRADSLVVTFNDASKSLALELALEGSLSGTLVGQDGSVVGRVSRRKGEGEQVVADLRRFVGALGGEVPDASAPGLQADNLFRAACKRLNGEEAHADDPRYRRLWTFANRYLGRRAPVSRLVRLRALCGKETVLVATPEAVLNSSWKTLLA